MHLDDPAAVLAALETMRLAGSNAHHLASEDNGKTGPARDLLFGLNTLLDGITALVEEQTP